MSIKTVLCACNNCGVAHRIPHKRFRLFEEYFKIPTGSFYVWTCDDCLEGVIVPLTYVNNKDHSIEIDPKRLPYNTLHVDFLTNIVSPYVSEDDFPF